MEKVNSATAAISFVISLAGMALTPGCVEGPGQAPGKELVQIDHLVVGVSDLEIGAGKLEEMTGVRPVYGGEHPGAGSHNALIALGDRQYLELLAPRPGADAELDPSYVFLKTLSEPTLIWWGVSSEDIALTEKTLEAHGFETSGQIPGSRNTPDGSKLQWVGVELREEIEGAPFFIQWSEETVHPAETSPEGCRLRSFEVAGPSFKRLRDLIQAVGLAIKVNEGAQTTLNAVLDCPNGKIQL